MTTQKDHLKAMIGHTIDKNTEAAKVSLHAYLAAKIQDSISKAQKSK